MSKPILYKSIHQKYYHTIKRYFESRYGFNHHDADELTGDTLITLDQKWDEVKEYGEEQILDWLYKTARYKALEFYRRKKKVPMTVSLEENLVGDLDSVSFDDLLSVDQASTDHQYQSYILNIKQILTEKERRTFECIVEKGYSVSQTAKELHTKEGTIKVRYFRLRKKIKQQLHMILK